MKENVKEETRNKSSHIRFPVIFCLAIVAGMLIGARFSGTPTTENGLRGSIEKFKQVITFISGEYVDPVVPEELVDKAILEMLKDLDPHSVYITGKELELAQSQLRGEYSGIGIEFSIFRDTLYVVRAFNGGPSASAGLRSGDKIVTVDGETIAGVNITNEMVFDKLRGKKNTKVAVQVKRRGIKKLIDYNIIRGSIPQYAVDVSYMLDDDKTGYLKVNKFSLTTYDEFKLHMNKLLEEGMEQLVLDLTDNPGGYLDRAVRMVDEMISGSRMIVYTEGQGSRSNSEYRTSRSGALEKMPIVVMVDEGSASASEIVAGALQDHDRAIIVGRRTFGKGLVQVPFELTDGSELRLTISRYYTPSGRSIQKPYEGKNSAYERDILDRFSSGEMYSRDSIKLVDSLRFKTKGGRIVYGGGGIMPDHFVPLDSSMSSTYLNALFTGNTLRTFSLNYANDHKEELEKLGKERFLSEYKVTREMLDEMVRLGKENDLPLNNSEFERSLPLIRAYVKAYIARGIWDNEGFYPVFNKTRPAYRKAVQVFDEARKLSMN